MFGGSYTASGPGLAWPGGAGAMLPGMRMSERAPTLRTRYSYSCVTREATIDNRNFRSYSATGTGNCRRRTY